MNIIIFSNGNNPAQIINGVLDLSTYQEPTLSVLQAAFDSNDYVEVVDIISIPILVQPNWESLTNEILGGALTDIYTRLTQACFVNPTTATIAQIANANNIAVAAGKLDQAVAVTRIEEATASSFQLLINTSDYRFNQAEKNLWDTKVAELNFSSLIYLP